MTSRMYENLMKALVFFIIFMVLLFQSVFTSAQTYKGLDVHFGTRLFSLPSDIDKLDQREMVQNGARTGFIFGKKLIRANAGAGYYSSTEKKSGTLEQYKGSLHCYPLDQTVINDQVQVSVGFGTMPVKVIP